MIRVATGEFKLDDHELIIHPELTLADFRRGDIPITATVYEKKNSGIYCFLGYIDGMPSRFQITFADDRLYKLYFAENVVLYDQEMITQELVAATKKGHDVYIAELKKWTEMTDRARRKQMDKHDVWLEKVIGSPPPYEYDNWGEIVSLIDPRDGDVGILVRFKCDFGEETDLKAYFENRREQEHRLAMNPPKPLYSSKLPPGFSRKV